MTYRQSEISMMVAYSTFIKERFLYEKKRLDRRFITLDLSIVQFRKQLASKWAKASMRHVETYSNVML